MLPSPSRSFTYRFPTTSSPPGAPPQRGALRRRLLVLEGLNAVEAECDGAKLEDFTRTQLDVKVSTRATQTSVDAFVANFNSLSTLINSRLDVAVSTRATQTSVDAFTATLNSLSTLVNSRLDVAVSTRATQTSLNTFHSEFTSNATIVNTKLDGITSSLASAHDKLDSLMIVVGDQGKLALRLQIEADLSEPGTRLRCSRSRPRGRLPRSHSRIVLDTIAKMQAVGRESVMRKRPCRRRCRPRCCAGLQGCVQRLRQGVPRRGNVGSSNV